MSTVPNCPVCSKETRRLGIAAGLAHWWCGECCVVWYEPVPGVLLMCVLPQAHIAECWQKPFEPSAPEKITLEDMGLQKGA